MGNFRVLGLGSWSRGSWVLESRVLRLEFRVLRTRILSLGVERLGLTIQWRADRIALYGLSVNFYDPFIYPSRMISSLNQTLAASCCVFATVPGIGRRP